jgi:hypothetical protein
MVEGKFVALDVATLTTMLTEWRACLSAIAAYDSTKGIASGLQSYSIAGRSFTRADLAQVSDMVAELSYALSLKTGQLVRTTYADMSC